MTINIVVGNAHDGLKGDWRTVYPVTSTGAKVTQDIDNVWIEVNKPVGKDWVLQKEVLATGFDADLKEGRYLYIDCHFRMAVTLSGLHVTWKKEKYSILAISNESARHGELNPKEWYTMVPSKNLYKIEE